MLRAIAKILFFTSLVVSGSVGLYVYFDRSPADRKLAAVEQEKRELEQVVQRLETDRRVAKILVTDQKMVKGQLKTTLLFVEYGRDGSAMPPREFTIDGDEAHFDAEIIKFKDEYIKKGDDPLRSQSIMLFVRVYGADQAPDAGFPIDTPGKIPDIYRGTDPEVSSFEQDLWNNFWTLYNNKAAREAKGIRGLHGEGLWGKFDLDHVYIITIRSDGDGTLVEEPLEPIYREAIRQHEETPN
jgi:hypothetical protein